VQCRVRKPDQKEEARLAFEALIQSMPEVPALLVHQVTMLVAARLPGTDTHYFGPDVSVDDPDADVWRPWVVGQVGSNICASAAGSSTNSSEVAS